MKLVRLLSPTLAFGLLLGTVACSDSDASPSPSPTVPTEDPTTTTTEPTDPYAIPADPANIDPAYVERVTNALYKVLGDAARLAKHERAMPPEVVDRINAVYHSTLASTMQADFQTQVVQGFPGALDGDNKATIHDIAYADTSCVVATMTLDASEAVEEPTDFGEILLVLDRPDDSADPAGYNPTPWIIRETALDETPDGGGARCAD